MGELCAHCFYPREARLRGRAGIIWFNVGGIDLVLVCVYCYVQHQRGATGGDIRNEVLWNWVTKHLQMLPLAAAVSYTHLTLPTNREV